jgi:hypothetical protein
MARKKSVNKHNDSRMAGRKRRRVKRKEVVAAAPTVALDREHWECDDPFYRVDGEKFGQFYVDCWEVTKADMDRSYTWQFGPEDYETSS